MATNAAEVRKLRTELENRFGRAIVPSVPGPREGGAGLATGVGALDRLVPEGVARGRLTLWAGEATSGRTAALRSLVLGCCAGGGVVAVVDAGRTLDASFACTATGPVEGVWVVRPPEGARAGEAAWAAEALLRSGVFDLVVLDGCLPESGEAHRLRALARDRDAALLVSVGLGSEEGGRSGRDGRARRGNGTDRSGPAAGGGLLTSGYGMEARPSSQGARAGSTASRVPRSLSNRGHSLAWPLHAGTPAHEIEDGEDEPGLSSLFPLELRALARSAPSSLPFRPDVRMEFRQRRGGRGLRRGGRFRRRGEVRLVKGSSSALRGEEREVELRYEPADRVHPGPRIPDRSAGGR